MRGLIKMVDRYMKTVQALDVQAMRVSLKRSREELRSMQQVKIFETHENPKYLEPAVNKWLSENRGIKVVQCLQSETREKGITHLTPTIFYMQPVFDDTSPLMTPSI